MLGNPSYSINKLFFQPSYLQCIPRRLNISRSVSARYEHFSNLPELQMTGNPEDCI